MKSALIHLERTQGGYVDRLRSYEVILDGGRAASIARGQSLTLEAEAGHHALHLRIDWCRSSSVNLDLSAGQEIRIRCWPNARPTLKLFYWITFGRSRYIGIELVDATDNAAGDPRLRPYERTRAEAGLTWLEEQQTKLRNWRGRSTAVILILLCIGCALLAIGLRAHSDVETIIGTIDAGVGVGLFFLWPATGWLAAHLHSKISSDYDKNQELTSP